VICKPSGQTRPCELPPAVSAPNLTSTARRRPLTIGSAAREGPHTTGRRSSTLTEGKGACAAATQPSPGGQWGMPEWSLAECRLRPDLAANRTEAQRAHEEAWATGRTNVWPSKCRPRTFGLSRSGGAPARSAQQIWFDLNWSRSTRHSGIRKFHPPPPAPPPPPPSKGYTSRWKPDGKKRRR